MYNLRKFREREIFSANCHGQFTFPSSRSDGLFSSMFSLHVCVCTCFLSLSILLFDLFRQSALRQQVRLSGGRGEGRDSHFINGVASSPGTFDELIMREKSFFHQKITAEKSRQRWFPVLFRCSWSVMETGKTLNTYEQWHFSITAVKIFQPLRKLKTDEKFCSNLTVKVRGR